MRPLECEDIGGKAVFRTKRLAESQSIPLRSSSGFGFVLLARALWEQEGQAAFMSTSAREIDIFPADGLRNFSPFVACRGFSIAAKRVSRRLSTPTGGNYSRAGSIRISNASSRSSGSPARMASSLAGFSPRFTTRLPHRAAHRGRNLDVSMPLTMMRLSPV